MLSFDQVTLNYYDLVKKSLSYISLLLQVTLNYFDFIKKFILFRIVLTSKINFWSLWFLQIIIFQLILTLFKLLLKSKKLLKILESHYENVTYFKFAKSSKI